MHLHRQSRSCASRRLSVSANRTSDPLASWARFLHGWLPRGLRFPPLGLSRMRGLRGNPHRAGAAGHPAAWAGSDLQRSRKGFRYRDGRRPSRGRVDSVPSGIRTTAHQCRHAAVSDRTFLHEATKNLEQ